MGDLTHARKPGVARLIEWSEAGVRAVVRPVAFAGVLGMLCIAVLMVIGILLRWAGYGGIPAMNEIVAMLFAVAVVATLPAATAQRAHLKIDLLGALIGPRLRLWLDALGAILLLTFLALLASEVQVYGGRLIDSGRTTPILGWSVGHVMLAISVLLWVTTAAQVMVVVADLGRALAPSGLTAGRTHPAVWAILTVTLIVLIGATALLWSDFRGMSRSVTAAPMGSVGIAFALLWLTMLLLMPVSAVMGLMGLVGTALFLNWRAAWSVFSSETMDFLTNPQIAALPLFLLMGSFALMAGLSDDVYRLAKAVVGRFRGGLALATIGGCAGFGAVTGSSLATVATFGRISVPQMKAAGYAPHLAAGTVAAGGTLGALIPPSSPLILFALLTEASIGALFIAAIVPGIMAALFYMLTVAIVVRRDPSAAPAALQPVRGEWKRRCKIRPR